MKKRVAGRGVRGREGCPVAINAVGSNPDKGWSRIAGVLQPPVPDAPNISVMKGRRFEVDEKAVACCGLRVRGSAVISRG